MRTVIIDDSKLNRDVVRILLDKHFDEIDIIGEANSVKSAQIIIKELKPDLVFLDIELGDGDAFELLNKLRNIDFSIIFVTAYDQYALKAFEVNAVDYLLKPISINKLKKATYKILKNKNDVKIEQLVKYIKQTKSTDTNDLITISSTDELEFININTIIRLEADGKYTKCFTTLYDKPILSSNNLGEYEKTLENKSFFRTHHSHIINIKFITKFNKKESLITLLNGVKIPLAQRKKYLFFEFMENI